MSNMISSYGIPNGAPQQGFGGTIASARSLPVSRQYDSYAVTGTASIIGLTSLPRGSSFMLSIEGRPKFVHSAQLQCPKGVDYQAANGDLIIVRSDGNGVWRVFPVRAGDVQGPFAFGAVGDGAADETTALTASFGALKSGMVWDGEGKNFANACTLIDLPANVTIRNATFTLTGAGTDPMFKVMGTRTPMTYSGGAIAAGATSITLAGLTSADAGKTLHIQSSDTIGVAGFTRGELAFIRSVSGSTVTLEGAIALAYTTSPTVELVVFKPGVKFQNVTFECNLGSANLRTGMLLVACSHAECEIYGHNLGQYTVCRMLCYQHHVSGGGSNEAFQTDNGFDYFLCDAGGKLLSADVKGRAYRHVYTCGWEESTQFDTRVRVISHAGKDVGADAHPNVIDFQVEVLTSGPRNGGTFSNQPAGLMYQGGGILRAIVDVNGYSDAAATLQLMQNTSDQVYISVQGKAPATTATRGLDILVQKSGGVITTLDAEFNGDTMSNSGSRGISLDTSGSAAGVALGAISLKGMAAGREYGKLVTIRAGHTATNVKVSGVSFGQASGGYGVLVNSEDAGGITTFNANGNTVSGAAGVFGIRSINVSRSLATGNLITGVGGAAITTNAIIGFTTQSANDYT